MRVASVVGARPQFIKAAVLSREFSANGIEEHLVHTGQHYDRAMSQAFFEDLDIREPEINLEVGSGSHAAQTGEMMLRLEPVIGRIDPDCVVIYGDTNSTLAGALVGAKLRVPVAHVEAGLRSFNRAMPEEINRLVADRVADLLLAPGELAASQLKQEGIDRPIAIVGDLMVDLAGETLSSLSTSAILTRFGVRPREFALATIHRAGNTEDFSVFARLLDGLERIGMPVLFPVHPRTKELISRLGLSLGQNVKLCEPVRYRESIGLQQQARVVITDSGGVQKESVTLGTPCVTLRDETEWPETLEEGWNVLAGSVPERIAAAALRPLPRRRIRPFGEGGCASRIVNAMRTYIPVPSSRRAAV
jgi:UDP-GlcNAc3NAcA epimerase